MPRGAGHLNKQKLLNRLQPNSKEFWDFIISNLSNKRTIKGIVIHGSATFPHQNLSALDIKNMHLAKGWQDIGYHYVIPQDGSLELGRDLDGDGDVSEEIGAHVSGFNKDTIGICYIGGLDDNGKADDTRTHWQRDTLLKLLVILNKKYPNAWIKGHRDLSPDIDGDGVIERHEWLKECPCFDVEDEYGFLKNQ